MKIVYIFNKFEKIGGIEKVLTSKINALCENKENEIYLISDKSEEEFNSYFPLSKDLKIIFLNLDRNSPKYTREYKRLVEKVLNSIKADICISVVYTVPFYFLFKIKDGSKKITEFHTCYDFFRGFTNFRSNWKKALGERLFFYKHIGIIKKYDRLVVLSDSDMPRWKKHLNNVEVIPNFIDYNHNTVANSKKQAIAVGRLEGVKAFDIIISAWQYVYQKYPDFRLDIYGEGPLKKALQSKISSLGLDRVVFINEPTKEINTKYAESSFMISSSAFEGFPMVVLEGLNHGLPVVCTPQKGGVNSLITNKLNGLFSKTRNPEDLAKSIIEMIEMENIKDMRQNCKKTALQYDKSVVMKKWYSFFETLIKQ